MPDLRSAWEARSLFAVTPDIVGTSHPENFQTVDWSNGDKLAKNGGVKLHRMLATFSIGHEQAGGLEQVVMPTTASEARVLTQEHTLYEGGF